MKKITLLLTGLLSLFGLQSQAQDDAPTWAIIDTCQTTVTDPNVTFDVPSNDYLDITKAWIPSNTDPDNAKNAKIATSDDGNYFSNMRKGQFAVFHLNVTKASKLQINMQMATKESTGAIGIAIFDANHELEMYQVASAPKTGNWTKFQDNYTITDKKISTGEKTMVLIFDGSKYTVNVRNIQLAEFASSTYSFYPSVVSDDGNENAGTITVTPNVNAYVEGTEITVTATPNYGYKFVSWTDANGDVVSTSNTYTFQIFEDVDLDANFKHINMVNDIPGAINPDTKVSSNGTISYVEAGSKQPRFITDYNDKLNADTLNIKEGIPFFSDFRDGQYFSASVKVKEQAKYYISFLASSKQNEPELDVVFKNEDNTTADSVTISVPKTGQWFNYTKVSAQTNEEIPTTVNQIVVYFHENDAMKYTLNLMNLRITKEEVDPTVDEEGNSLLVGTVTGINSIKNNTEKDNDNVYYNLNGQRVSENYKGIVIRNGKKMIRK